MTPQEIIEGNKLIAEFMGYEKSSEDKDFIFYKHPDGKGIVIQSQHDCKVFHNHELMEIKSFIFHRSWDWLMPIVNKIRSLYNAAVDIPFDTVDVIAEGCIEANIIQVYTGVVEFIKWYNQNKEK